MLKVIELFAGIGAQVSALERLKNDFNFDYEIVAISEIDKYASESYELIHGKVNNLGDITKIERLPKADFWTYSSPCITNDSLIFTKDGYKEFKDLKVGDEVLTKSNTYHKIAKIFDNGIHQTCIVNELNIHCTLNHKFYIRKLIGANLSEPYFEEVQNLDKDCYLGIPSNAINDYNKRIKEIGNFLIGNTCWFPFKGYTLSNLEHVYNMEVEEDHSYIIQGCISKNCQDISQAGKQKGFEKGSGTRSGLLWEVDRLFQVAKEHNELPKYLLMENVKALVSDKFYDGFLGWLDILKSYGYKSFWKVLNAKDYGVPQNRERVFVVSILDKDAYYEFPTSFKLEKRIKDILEQEVDEKYYLSQKMIDGMKRSNFHTYQLDNLLLNDKDYAKTVTARFEGAPQCIQVGQTNGAYERANRTYSVDGISPTITTAKSQLSNIEEPLIVASRGRNPVNPNCKTSGIPTEQRLEVNEDGVGNTLTTFQKDNYVVEPKLRIRKLTPRECWRLMGFSDEQFDKVENKISNAQLYKQAGNSIVVDVLYYMFKELFINQKDRHLYIEHTNDTTSKEEEKLW